MVLRLREYLTILLRYLVTLSIFMILMAILCFRKNALLFRLLLRA
nr:MAG TPA: hypothetical protein [Caudoviricetes sp.]